ncbi:MAG: dTDP-4-dehydrorhamnose 3,5-epimerase family protein [Thermomicrobiales bacterium]|nr:dTDP-4-dehydrorhamnose 3,5-epimerase family protein [Thermomicrobiales bacterium]
MKILSITDLAIPEVKVLRFARFRDNRGYFSEHYRFSDFESGDAASFMNGVRFLQMNESFSKPHTVRGLHYQWNPFMGKLVRTVRGHMIDLVLDIRKGSPTYGKIVAYDMPVTGDEDFSEWIWVPPGFAHGNTFTEDTVIEYLCSGEYSPGNEAGISPIADDLDWSLCDPDLASLFKQIAHSTDLMTDKDRNGFSLAAWTADPRSENFLYDELS